MGGLALLARELGFEVSGCDENVYPPMSDLLKEQNIKVIKGYNKKDLPEADLYLIGNVISRGNESIEHILDSKLPHTQVQHGYLKIYLRIEELSLCLELMVRHLPQRC